MKAKYRGVVAFSLTFLFLLPVAAFAADLDLVVDEAGSRLSWQGTEFYATANQVVNERLVEVPGSPTALILWEEALEDGQNVPFYAISLGGEQIDRVRETSYVLKLRHGDFDPALGEPSPAAGLGASAGTSPISRLTIHRGRHTPCRPTFSRIRPSQSTGHRQC